MKRRHFLCLLLALAIGASAKPQLRQTLPTGPVRDTLHVGTAILRIEVANTDALRTQGLSDRKTMGWDEGMLFVFPDAEQRSFWMIDCHFDLDIAYVAPNGTIRDIQTMIVEPGVQPRDLARYPSTTSDIMYALEVNRGWFAAHGIKVGQKLPGIRRNTTSR